MSEFALIMDYANREVSEVQYIHDRAKYYNEVPSREEFLRFCESLLENEERCEHVADNMLSDYDCENCKDLQGDLNEKQEEVERLEKKADEVETLLNDLEKYFEAIKPRNEEELTLLKRIQIELYGESYA